MAGRRVGDLGAGAARHAAHLAVHHRPACVTAVEASPAQHAMAADLYVHLAPRLSVAHCDAVSHPQTMPGRYDVLYSVYGAIDFTDPRELLPATADVRARTPGGEETVMRRWALQEHVWTKLLHEADFAEVHHRSDTLLASANRP